MCPYFYACVAFFSIPDKGDQYKYRVAGAECTKAKDDACRLCQPEGVRSLGQSAAPGPFQKRYEALMRDGVMDMRSCIAISLFT